MNKTLEALDELSLMINREKHINSEWNKKINDLKQIIKQDIKSLKEINKVWHDNEPMESVDINGKHLQDLYDYNEELFNKNLELDKKVIELEKENQELIVNKNVAQAVAFDQKREIAELKDQLSYLKEELEGFQSLYEWSQAKNSILKLENQELEEQNKDLKITVLEYKAQENLYRNTAINNANLREENEKLKNKNQELKEENQKLKKDYHLLDTTMESDDRIICELLKEKECLKNDIKLNETQIDDLTLEVANYKHALEEKNEIIMDLKVEKEELEQKLAYECGCNSQFVDCQTTIEILKDILNLNVTQDKHNNYFLDGDIITEITKKQYDLLKEVLK